MKIPDNQLRLINTNSLMGKGILKYITFFILLTTCFVGCGKVRKWRSERKAQNEKISAGIDSRRAYFEKCLSPDPNRRIPESFYTYDGFRDWWRMPLVYPYQLMCIDSMNRTSLQKYDPRYSVEDPNKSSSAVRDAISRLQTDNRFLVFEFEDNSRIKYGLFEYASETHSIFDNEPSLWKAAENAGFVGKHQLISVEDMFSQYYKYEERFPN